MLAQISNSESKGQLVLQIDLKDRPVLLSQAQPGINQGPRTIGSGVDRQLRLQVNKCPPFECSTEPVTN
jgi:hypothetical protein